MLHLVVIAIVKYANMSVQVVNKVDILLALLL